MRTFDVSADSEWHDVDSAISFGHSFLTARTRDVAQVLCKTINHQNKTRDTHEKASVLYSVAVADYNSSRILRSLCVRINTHFREILH